MAIYQEKSHDLSGTKCEYHNQTMNRTHHSLVIGPIALISSSMQRKW